MLNFLKRSKADKGDNQGADARAAAKELLQASPSYRLRGGLKPWQIVDGHVRFEGWVVHPTHPIDEVTIRLCSQPQPPQPVRRREDRAGLFPLVPHAINCGFSAEIALGKLAQRTVLDVEIEGRARGADGGGQVVGAYRSIRLARDLTLPFPPPELMKRVSGTTDHPEFSQIGLQAAFDLMRTLETFRPGTTPAQREEGQQPVPSGEAGRARREGRPARVLDYGCGCGRVARFLTHFWPELEYWGCDIDAEAVAWCNENLRPGRFRTVPMSGPLPFEPGSFDIILGVSVMTHLRRQEQHRWLEELARVLAPQGLCILSTQGVPAAYFNAALPPHELVREGIVDRFPDAALDGVTPPGYYRSTLQSPAYTRREWSAHFEVREILEGGLNGYQDLVVLSGRR